MSTTAKIKLTSKGTPTNDQVNLGFNADYDDEKNKEWARYTPTLTLSMAVMESVAEKFELGASYTLTFDKE